jgi:error-prone DNA polymerase
LQDVHGISEAEMGSILEARAARPFSSVGDFLRRTGVSRPVAEALAHAGGFDHLPGGRDPEERDVRWTRRDRLFVAMTADPERDGEQMALPLGADHGPAGLREYTDRERVRAELEVTGMDLSRHLLSFYQWLLRDLGATSSVDLRRKRGDSWVMVAGVKVASQTPAVRSGQRIIFLTLDDATGPIEVTVFERVQERCARTVFHGFLLAVWGRLRRTGVGGVSVAAEEVWDLQLLESARREGRLLEAMREGAEPRETSRSVGRVTGYPASRARSGDAPRKMWHSSGGSSGW